MRIPNNKWTNIVLSLVALAVWVHTVRKYTAAPEAGPGGPVEEPFHEPPPAGGAPESFSLALDYRDPFLGHMPKSYTAPPAPAGHDPSAVPQDRPRLPDRIPEVVPEGPKWPRLAYHGFVKRQEGERQAALLSVDGRLGNVEPGDARGTVSVIAIYPDSIRLRMGEQDSTIQLR